MPMFYTITDYCQQCEKVGQFSKTAGGDWYCDNCGQRKPGWAEQRQAQRLDGGQAESRAAGGDGRDGD